MDAAVAALVARMESLLAPLEEGRDPARYFLGTYLRTTRSVVAALAAGRFEDPSWVAAWGWKYAYMPLAIGPALGIVAMARLRQLEHARRGATGAS